jgi:hypothetical protein
MSEEQDVVAKPVIPDQLMGDLADAYVKQKMQQFLDNNDAEEAARAVIASGETDLSSDTVTDIAREYTGSHFNFDHGDDLRPYFDDDSVFDFGLKIDELLEPALWNVVELKLFEILLTERKPTTQEGATI